RQARGHSRRRSRRGSARSVRAVAAARARAVRRSPGRACGTHRRSGAGCVAARACGIAAAPSARRGTLAQDRRSHVRPRRSRPVSLRRAAPGPQLSAGRLRVDAARAIAKLREYQLADKAAWVLEGIRAAVADQAKRIDLRADANDVWLSWEAEAWPDEL